MGLELTGKGPSRAECTILSNIQSQHSEILKINQKLTDTQSTVHQLQDQLNTLSADFSRYKERND